MQLQDARSIKIGDYVLDKLRGKRYLVREILDYKKYIVFICYDSELNVVEHFHTDIRRYK